MEEILDRVREKTRMEISWEKTRQLTGRTQFENTAKLNWSELARNRDIYTTLGESSSIPKEDVDAKPSSTASHDNKDKDIDETEGPIESQYPSFNSTPTLGSASTMKEKDCTTTTLGNVSKCKCTFSKGGKEEEREKEKKTVKAGDGFLTFERLKKFNERYGQGMQSAREDEEAMREEIRRRHRQYMEQYM
ncbi:hypothetical protein AA313_de0210002 [Arthrobotrys entomopaga]|nr:hypothetical protein AA313_de0210002 [Arthrobotrys entomopaga]